MSTQIQIRRDTSANWSAADPVLAEGELGYDLTSEQFKVGDGSTPWSGLEYSANSGGGELWEQNGDDIYYNDGNVSIGTDSPTEYSDFSGLTIDGDEGANLTLRRGGTVVGDIYATRNSNILSVVASEADGEIHFYTGGYNLDALAISSGGHITMSAGRLHLGTGTSADVSDYQYVGFGSLNGGESGWQLGKHTDSNSTLGNAGDFYLYSYESSKSVVDWSASGNMTVHGDVIATKFFGDGSGLTNLPSSGGGNDSRISDTQITNWDSAYGWGDHGSAGYATTTWVSTNYQPKGSYLTSSDQYATESWVSEGQLPDQ